MPSRPQQLNSTTKSSTEIAGKTKTNRRPRIAIIALMTRAARAKITAVWLLARRVPMNAPIHLPHDARVVCILFVLIKSFCSL